MGHLRSKASLIEERQSAERARHRQSNVERLEQLVDVVEHKKARHRPGGATAVRHASNEDIVVESTSSDGWLVADDQLSSSSDESVRATTSKREVRQLTRPRLPPTRDPNDSDEAVVTSIKPAPKRKQRATPHKLTTRFDATSSPHGRRFSRLTSSEEEDEPSTRREEETNTSQEDEVKKERSSNRKRLRRLSELDRPSSDELVQRRGLRQSRLRADHDVVHVDFDPMASLPDEEEEEEAALVVDDEEASAFVVDDEDDMEDEEEEEDEAWRQHMPAAFSKHLAQPFSETFKMALSFWVKEFRHGRAWGDRMRRTGGRTKEEVSIMQSLRKLQHTTQDRCSWTVTSQAWTRAFKEALEKLPLYRSTVLSQYDPQHCEACTKQGRRASKVVTLSDLNGHSTCGYDPVTLLPYATPRRGHTEGLTTEFFVGRHCELRSKLYSQLFHYEYNIVSRLRDRINEVSEKLLGKVDEDEADAQEDLLAIDEDVLLSRVLGDAEDVGDDEDHPDYGQYGNWLLQEFYDLTLLLQRAEAYMDGKGERD